MASEEQVERWVRRFHELVCAELFGHGIWGYEQDLYDAMLRAFEHMSQDAWPVPSTAPAPQPPAPQSSPKAIQALPPEVLVHPEPEEAKTAPEEVKPQPPEVEPEEPQESDAMTALGEVAARTVEGGPGASPLVEAPTASSEETALDEDGGPYEVVPPERSGAEPEQPKTVAETSPANSKPEPFTWDRFFAWCKDWRAKHWRDNYPQLTSESESWDFLAFSRSFPRGQYPQENWAFRLLALAWLFTRDENETRSNGEILQAEAYNVFGYVKFAQHSMELSQGLATLGASLRRSPNGNWQYVRTILYYSGWMYAQLASLVAERIRVRGWQFLADAEQLREVLKERVRHYQGQDDEGVLNDVVSFFQQVAQRYLRAKGLTVEDVREVNPGIKPDLAKSILTTLLEATLEATERQRRTRGRRKAVEVAEQAWTLPEIALDDQGRAILSFPESGTFAREVYRAVFCIDRLGQERAARVAYKRQADGSFQLEAGSERQVLLLDRRPMTSVRRILVGQEQQRLGEEEVLPEAVLGGDFLLLKVTRDEGDAWQLDEVIGNPNDDEETGVALHAGETYQVVPLRQRVQTIQVVTEGGDGQEVEQPLAEDRRFLPAEGWLQVRIAGVTYPVATQMDDYLRQRVPHVKRRGYTVYNGACSPFQWVKCEQKGVTAVYRLQETGKELKFTSADLHAGVPQAWHWKQGTLELHFPDERVLQRRVVFVDDVPSEIVPSEIECAAAYHKEAHAKVEIAGQVVPVTIPPFRDKVTVDFQGCMVHLAVPNRLGVAFELASGEAVAYVAPGDAYEAPQTKITRKDLESLYIRRLGKGSRHYFMTRGKTAIAHLEKRRFLYKEIPNQGLFEAEASPYYGITFCDVEKNALFPFKVYDPEKSEVETGRRIKVERDGCDLILTYWCSFLDRDRKKGLAFYPIHRQDEEARILWETEKVEEKCYVEEETNRYQECLRVRDFYTQDSDWGYGRLCFVVSKVEYINGNCSQQVISSGFLAKAPQELQTEIDNPNDEANELRKAFVGDTDCREDGKALERIMTSKDPKTHKMPKYVLDFLDRMCEKVNELGVFEYLNSYWNRLVPEEGARPTGFAFLCGAHVYKHLVKETFQPYRKLWSKELISDRDWEEITGTPRQTIEFNEAQAQHIVHTDEQHNNRRIVKQLCALPFRLQTAFVDLIRGQEVDDEVENRDQTGADVFFCEQEVFFNDPRELVYHENPQGNNSWLHDRRITRINPNLRGGFYRLSGERVIKVLEALGGTLRQWRANPTLVDAQPLRKGLVLLDEIDQTIQEIWTEMAALTEMPGQGNPGPISLTGVVALFAQTVAPHGQNTQL